MSIVLNGTTGITTPDIDSTSGLDAADLTGALPDLDGSALTGIVIPAIFDPVAVSGATHALDVGSYNFFDGGTLTVANTPVSFTSVPTNARWSYSFEPAIVEDFWDISTAIHVQNLPVEAQDTGVSGIFFKPDGTKMYIVGYTGDNVYEYDLSTDWDISTASFLQLFSVAAQDVNPVGIFFKPDGTKMYISGLSGQDINEYDLSTAWDVSTASYLQSFLVGTQDTGPWGVFFKPDGTKMYVTGYVGDNVYEYNLSTAWNISTASYLQNFYLGSQDTIPRGIFFKSDGTKMYITGDTGNDVNEYNLSTAWSVTTASYLQNFVVSSQDSAPQGVFFKPDGTKMYVIGDRYGDKVNEYDVGTASTVTLPAAVKNNPSQALRVNKQVTYEFFTMDGGTTVKLIGEEIV
jgi:DNA-binding beta-propeller fold protein YncE